MMPPLDAWSTPELHAAVMAQFDLVISDHDQRPELDARLADIYDALADSGLRDWLAVIDAAINAHLAVAGGMALRGAVLDEMLAECEKPLWGGYGSGGLTFRLGSAASGITNFDMWSRSDNRTESTLTCRV